MESPVRHLSDNGHIQVVIHTETKHASVSVTSMVRTVRNVLGSGVVRFERDYVNHLLFVYDVIMT